ncbi:MAG: rhomboid family intramembrane serine protease [Desulfovibrionaceae bacterium]|nr:rhomboid family intramembrane serine protease [Desulfovibrionaceae bacterium]
MEVNDGRPLPPAASPQSAAWRRRDQVDSWSLTCSALNIPWRVDGKGLRRTLYVPALYGQMAREQFAEISSERTPAEEASPPRRKNAHLALGLFLPLLVWHGITRHWWLAWGPSGQQWEAMGALRADRVLSGEFFRAVTALTLHADSVHLFGNILFGAPFFILLCGRIGAGAAMLLTLFAGACANICEALYRHNASMSLGFSTALFAVVGLHAAFLAMDELRLAQKVRQTEPGSLRRGIKKSLVFLACGGAILAALGADPAPKSDYAAHIFGLLVGLLTGFAAALCSAKIKDSPARQALCGAIALCLAAGAWIWAVVRGS